MNKYDFLIIYILFGFKASRKTFLGCDWDIKGNESE